MSRHEKEQGPCAGSPCVAGPGGYWGNATIRRVNEDGTFNVEFDVKQMTIMPEWFGVTASELSIDDAALWENVFSCLSPDGKSFNREHFQAALILLGYQVPPERASSIWNQACQQLFNAQAEQVDGLTLDKSTAYQLFLQLGISAKSANGKLQSQEPSPYFTLYWNQTRMGGRDPGEISRPVDLNDALAALGLSSKSVDDSAARWLDGLEQEFGIRLPTTLVELLRCAGVRNAITHCHPNNPHVAEIEPGEWKLLRDLREQNLNGEYGLVVLLPHQGDHEWMAVFDNAEQDARVYVRRDAQDGGDPLLVAPSIGMFFWDLAQTGLSWYESTKFHGGKPVQRSDIGLILSPSG
jgi:hypothetical protein